MDFNAKRMALLAGVGDPNDRHDIVQGQIQQLNESVEARQLKEDEEGVRKAVRRTIQKMLSEGKINLHEDSIARELEHLRANIKADHDHLEALLGDMHHDRDEIERAEHHREEMREGEMEEGVEDNIDSDLKAKGEWEKDMLSKSSDDGYHDMELDNPDLDDHGLAESEKSEKTLSESDATLQRMQMLAGVQILSEGRDEDLEEMHCGTKKEDEEHMGEGEDDGTHPAPPAFNQRVGQPLQEDEVEEEAKLYEMDDGSKVIELAGVKYYLSEVEEELNELEEDEKEIPDGATHATADSEVSFFSREEVSAE